MVIRVASQTVHLWFLSLLASENTNKWKVRWEQTDVLQVSYNATGKWELRRSVLLFFHSRDQTNRPSLQEAEKVLRTGFAQVINAFSATKCTPVEGLEPPATRLKAERSDPLSYTSEGGAYCCRIHWLLRIYACVETARTILWEPACSEWSVSRTTQIILSTLETPMIYY